MRHTSLSAIFFFLLYLQNDETLLCVNELDGNAFKFNQNDNKKKEVQNKIQQWIQFVVSNPHKFSFHSDLLLIFHQTNIDNEYKYSEEEKRVFVSYLMNKLCTHMVPTFIACKYQYLALAIYFRSKFIFISMCCLLNEKNKSYRDIECWKVCALHIQLRIPLIPLTNTA